MILNNTIDNEIVSLTSFRFITAFMIFLSHAGLFLNLRFNIWYLDGFIQNSSIFMTGFFVLSGYILSQIYSDKDFRQNSEVVSFYIKRFARIYPVYAIVTIVFFVLFPWGNFSYADWLRIFINDIFLTQGFFPNVSDLGINCITWSVSVEAFFYLCFPLIIVLFRHRPKLLMLLSLLMSFIISINILGDVYTSYDSLHRLALYYTNPFFRINEFMLGIAFNILNNRKELEFLPSILKSNSFIFLMIYLIAISPFSGEAYSHMGGNFLVIPLFGLLICNFHRAKSGFLMRSRLLKFLGTISYSFYLWQFMTFIIAIYIIQIIPVNLFLALFLVFIANSFIAYLSYRFIENPCRVKITKFLLSSNKPCKKGLLNSG